MTLKKILFEAFYRCQFEQIDFWDRLTKIREIGIAINSLGLSNDYMKWEKTGEAKSDKAENAKIMKYLDEKSGLYKELLKIAAESKTTYSEELKHSFEVKSEVYATIRFLYREELRHNEQGATQKASKA